MKRQRVSSNQGVVSPCVGDLGNTNRGPQSKRWVFTVNNYTEEDIVSLVAVFSSSAKRWIIGKEVGANGTPHLQGYVEWKSRQYGSKLSVPTKNRSHNEVARGSLKENYEYCKKEGVVVSEHGMPEEIEVIKELYEWQQELWDILSKKPDRRTVHWYWSEKGHNGKTELCRKVCVEMNAILVGGCAGDAKCAVAAMEEKPKVIMFNVARGGSISYPAIEVLKDGLFFSGKYESGMVKMNPPHVVVFANYPPDTDKLTEDRWRIVCLD